MVIELLLALAVAYPITSILVAAILAITNPDDGFAIDDDDYDPFIAFVVLFWPAFVALVALRLLVKAISTSPVYLAKLINKATRMLANAVVG